MRDVFQDLLCESRVIGYSRFLHQGRIGRETFDEWLSGKSDHAFQFRAIGEDLDIQTVGRFRLFHTRLTSASTLDPSKSKR